MYWEVRFRQPYDAINAHPRVAIVRNVTTDAEAAALFRRAYPDAESVSAKCMRGDVWAVIDASGFRWRLDGNTQYTVTIDIGGQSPFGGPAQRIVGPFYDKESAESFATVWNGRTGLHTLVTNADVTNPADFDIDAEVEYSRARIDSPLWGDGSEFTE